MNENLKYQVEDMKALAEEALPVRQTAEAAVAGERDAAAILLRQIVDLVIPALRVICSTQMAFGQDTRFRGVNVAAKADRVLILAEDGEFIVRKDGGFCPLSDAEVVSERWSIESIAEKLADEFAASVGGQRKLAERARRLERKLRAVSELLSKDG